MNQNNNNDQRSIAKTAFGGEPKKPYLVVGVATDRITSPSTSERWSAVAYVLARDRDDAVGRAAHVMEAHDFAFLAFDLPDLLHEVACLQGAMPLSERFPAINPYYDVDYAQSNAAFVAQKLIATSRNDTNAS